MGTTTLLIDQRGEIACPDHAPYPGSDTWVWDAWRPMTAEELAGFEAELDRPPACETCDAIARRRRAS